jgi:hypothetical protein
MPTPLFTMRDALERDDLLGTVLSGDSWRAWRVLLIGAAGERLSWFERHTFTKLTGRKQEPDEPVDELIVAAGRRGGKSRAAAAKAIYLSTMVDYSDIRASGEKLRCVFLARDQRQAKVEVVFDYCLGIIEASPMLQEMVTNKTQDVISLSDNVELEIKTASASGIRGVTAIAIIADEAAHWVTDRASSNADTEILNAARPAWRQRAVLRLISARPLLDAANSLICPTSTSPKGRSPYLGGTRHKPRLQLVTSTERG